MGLLEELYTQKAPPTALGEIKRLESALFRSNGALEKAVLSAHALLEKQISRADKAEQQDVLRPLKEAQSAILAAIKVIPKPINHSDDFAALEALIRGEINAIPAPEKPNTVDLQPVIQAVDKVGKGISEMVSGIKMPEMPEIAAPEPRKTQWTFNIIRNKNTGLIERIEAE